MFHHLIASQGWNNRLMLLIKHCMRIKVLISSQIFSCFAVRAMMLLRDCWKKMRQWLFFGCRKLKSIQLFRRTVGMPLLKKKEGWQLWSALILLFSLHTLRIFTFQRGFPKRKPLPKGQKVSNTKVIYTMKYTMFTDIIGGNHKKNESQEYHVIWDSCMWTSFIKGPLLFSFLWGKWNRHISWIIAIHTPLLFLSKAVSFC